MVQMNSKSKKEEIEEDDKMEADVSDEEMARRYIILNQYWLCRKIWPMLWHFLWEEKHKK